MKDLSDLCAVADAVLEGSLARLRAAEAARRATTGDLADLDASRNRQDAELAQAFETGMSGRVRTLWGTWEGARRAEINARLAGQRAAAEAARSDAKHAFGRAEALRLLAGRMHGHPGGKRR